MVTVEASRIGSIEEEPSSFEEDLLTIFTPLLRLGVLALSVRGEAGVTSA